MQFQPGIHLGFIQTNDSKNDESWWTVATYTSSIQLTHWGRENNADTFSSREIMLQICMKVVPDGSFNLEFIVSHNDLPIPSVQLCQDRVMHNCCMAKSSALRNWA